ncbi:MAG: hypothetical protein H6622_03675 [Halobacteriovoraceae bacterium]|nr:hypothetical protein [Halobacteriovoraceae bacterium]
MRLELFHKSILMKNLIIYLLISPFFLHIISSIDSGYSAFDENHFKEFFFSYYWIFILSILTSRMVFLARSYSRIFIFFHSLAILGLSVSFFWGNFNKFILILIFLFTLFSFLFFLLWKLELNEPYLRPNFDIYQIGDKSLIKINCILKMKEVSYVGHLTNWDQLGCFMYIFNPITELYQTAILEVEFEGQIFSQNCTIVSKYENAVGLRFILQKTNSFFGHEWPDFYAIIAHRGYLPG